MHRLLSRQIARATQNGTLDTEKLIDQVDGAYGDFDRDNHRLDRASLLMSEELEAANATLRRSLREISRQSRRFQATLDNMPHGVCLYDDQGRILECNRRFYLKYGLSDQQTYRGLTLTEALASGGQPDRMDLPWRLLVMENVALPIQGYGEIEQHWPDGRVMRISRSGVEGGGFLDTIVNVTEAHKARQRIQHMASFDALTDLPNRVLCRERLKDAVEAAREGEMGALLCLDLDRFKAVNDTLGHAVGDQLLVQATRRLKKILKPQDTVARLGGDEFAVVLRHLKSTAEAHRIARRLISHLSMPYEINGHQALIGASIGIEFIDEKTSGVDELLRNADLALYRAKANGRGSFAVYVPELHEQLSERRQLEIDMRQALKANEFFVLYQPFYCVKSQTICGYEALVRWRSAKRGIVSPADFIPLAEETGLIEEIGAWVLRQACTDALDLPDHMTMAVNLSPVQFKSRKIVPLVRTILAETGLSPQRLELEITEGVMIGDQVEALSILKGLKDLGVRISLDDFGTGYSSFSYVRAFPFDKIKIDQSFVRDLGRTTDSLAIIRAVAGMCSSLGITSTAEGVETDDQFHILEAEHCDTLQGYLFGRPGPLQASDIQTGTAAQG
ncbi:EAL domain-containing protein [Asticcacaulis sp. BYS171W]|uniref:EAL domain-containing protein n=1 Tax=Asticcacaulis aquaticus TaxID=2984212 RepID=A0ABT5HTZ4_9CAUL|nr:EAL domain-containing protein [Asticcacaulis aquaticus]MDC7683315.1 EAL domain-containing protein [Asticcacaulis aquaticus]